MGAEQKYTMVNIEEGFADKMDELDPSVKIRMAHKMVEIARDYDAIPNDTFHAIMVTVNDMDDVPCFLKLVVYKDEDAPLSFMDIEEVHVDDYLDYLNENK